MNALHYTVNLTDPAGHYLDVNLRFDPADGEKHTHQGVPAVLLRQPTWIPGSYLIREFSKNVLWCSAQSHGRPLAVTKTAKDEWAVLIDGAVELEVNWRVYAWDLSVRGAHFDQSHAFFNGTGLFLCPVGLETAPIVLTLNRPQSCGNGDWLVCSGLNAQVNKDLFNGCRRLAAGASLRWRAQNFDHLIDHPFEMGSLQTAEFVAHGVPHYLAFYGADQDLDLARLCEDLQPVCESQIALFEPETRAAPFSGYWFMTHATADGYGGLEHGNSTALVCSRNDLPQKGVDKAPDGYETFLGLCSHEYFHAWNVKRIKPAAFVPYRLREENYTRLLWLFEGFTSYYDDLMLCRSGKMSESAYLKALSKTISSVNKNPGTAVQPVAESSFEAWTKYYRQDENAPNAIVSYYTKGALVAFCLDVHIRLQSKCQKSLDDVMRWLWTAHGLTGVGLDECGFAEAVKSATGLDLKQELDCWTQTTEPLPIAECLELLGCKLQADSTDKQVDLGANVVFKPEGALLKQVVNGGTAHSAGLSAGDVLLALGAQKATEHSLNRMQRSTPAGTRMRALAFRAERLLEVELVWQAVKPNGWTISVGKNEHESNAVAKPWFA